MREPIERLRERLAHSESEAFVSVSPPSNQYLSGLLTGFLEISSGIVVSASEAHFMCDFRYTEQAQDQVSGFEISQIKGDLLARCGERLSDMNIATAAYDPTGFTVDEMDRLTAKYDGTLIPDKDLIRSLRCRKSAEEVAAIRHASLLAEGVMTDIVPTLKPGITERELASQFEYEFKRRGATGVSFDTIALFGPRSSLPHGEPGTKALTRGDVVLLDFGCRREGYCSDLTRTYAFGTMPGAWFEEIYELTLTAQVNALEAVRPGACCRDVDAVARNIITEGGYGDYFGHGLGHGVGIEIHEPPRLNTECEITLREGMVVTVEPGIYLPGRGGVRIEDLVVVTADGCDVLTQSPKELKVLAG